MSSCDCDIADPARAEAGRARIEWAAAEMPVLAGLRQRFADERPLEGLVAGGCLHVTTETANLARTLAAGGAQVALCASNPLSTQDDVAAALVEEYGIPVFARRGDEADTYYGHIRTALDRAPRVTLDDGADLVSTLPRERRRPRPSAVMDMSFANRALAVAHLAAHGAALAPAVHPVPAEIDREVARLKLAAMGLAIDRLTAEQAHYLSSWQEGT